MPKLMNHVPKPRQASPPGPGRKTEAGAITIMVALMLLILLTISAIGMSRNSFREVVNSGFSRQSVMASNVADAGLEWAVYWTQLGVASSAAGDALNLVTLENNLAGTKSLAGVAKTITDPSGATSYSATPASLPLTAGSTAPAAASPAGVIQGYTIGVTFMGQLDPPSSSPPGPVSTASGSGTNMNPYLWAIRSDAQIQQNNVTFTHSKEAWVVSPFN